MYEEKELYHRIPYLEWLEFKIININIRKMV